MAGETDTFRTVCGQLRHKQVRITTMAGQHPVFVGIVEEVHPDLLRIKEAGGNQQVYIRLDTVVSIQEAPELGVHTV